MAHILQYAFSNAFSWRKHVVFYKKKYFFDGGAIDYKQMNGDLGNGLLYPDHTTSKCPS